jgi:hypothetical protein
MRYPHDYGNPYVLYFQWEALTATWQSTAGSVVQIIGPHDSGKGAAR